MQLWRQSGTYLFVTGIIHNVVGLMLGWDVLLKIAGDGFFNAVGLDHDRNSIFWFLFSGVALMILGKLSQWIIRTRNAPPPSFLGWYLFVLALAGAFMMPVSGFWLIIPQGLIIMFPGRHGTPKRPH